MFWTTHSLYVKEQTQNLSNYETLKPECLENTNMYLEANFRTNILKIHSIATYTVCICMKLIEENINGKFSLNKIAKNNSSAKADVGCIDNITKKSMFASNLALKKFDYME